MAPHLENTGWRFSAHGLLAIALVAAAALAFGWPTRHGAFLRGDDQRFVVENVLVSHPSAGHAWRLLTTVHGDLYQPVPMLSFQADYALASADPAARFGIGPYVFHVTNIILHALNALLAYLIALRLTGCRPTALLVGLMFACHPLALEPVAWISGRMILLVTTFSLLLILICLMRRPDGRGPWAWLGGLAWLLALLSKVLPSVPIAAAWCDYHLHHRLTRRCWITYAVLLAAGLAATVLAVGLTRSLGMIELTEAETTTSTPVRILLAGRYYFESYLWPSRMAAWSPPPQQVPLASVETGIALLEWAAFGALLWLARRFSRPSYIGLGLFLILIAPFLAATGARRILTADRYMYLPMIGLHLAGAAVLVRISANLARRLRPGLAAGIVALPCLALVAAWMAVGWDYANCWVSTVARDRRVVEVYPDRVETHIELAKAHVFQKEPDAALQVVAEARRLWPDPDDPRLASEAGEACRLKKDWPRAARELAFAARRMPNKTRTQYYYALTLEKLGKIEEARAIYRQILERSAGFLPAATALARSYRASGEVEAAVGLFERAIEISPYHRDSLFELALLEIRRQEWGRACALLKAIIEIDPQDAPALLNLGVATCRSGEPAEALAIYDRVLALDPNAATARVNRAGLLAGMDQDLEAESEYRRVLKAQPDHRDAAIGLHELLQQQQRFGELADLWQSFQGAGGDADESRAWLAWAYVLADDLERARQSRAAIPETAPQRTFADWALAYDALGKRDDGRLRRLLGKPQVPEAVSPHRREQARAVLAALSALPRETRESPAGLYALARALLFEGDAVSARATALQMLRMSGATEWSVDTRHLADLLESSDSNGVN
jgi:tetratricopeptide (TPR) repeat protein